MESTSLDCLSPEEAEHLLEESVERHGLHPEKAEFARERYRDLHVTLHHSEAAEKLLSIEANRLERQLGVEKPLPEKGVAAMGVLRDDLKAAQVELLVATEREASANETILELREDKTQVEFQLEMEKEQRRMELSPVLHRLGEDVREMQEGSMMIASKVEKTGGEITDVLATIDACQSQVEQLKKERDEETAALSATKNTSVKMTRQSDAVEYILNGLQSKKTEQEAILSKEQFKLTRLMNRQKEAEMEVAQMALTVERGHMAVEGRRGDLKDIQHDIDATLMDHRHHLADRVQLDLLTEEKMSTLRRHIQEKIRAFKAKEATLKLMNDAASRLALSKEQLTPLEIAIDKLKQEKQSIEKDIRLANETRATLKREEDCFMSEYLKVEAKEGSIDALLTQILHYNSSMETEIESHRAIEQANTTIIHQLQSDRDALLRDQSQKERQRQEKEAALQLENHTVLDLEGLQREQEQHRQKFQTLYDLMKNERNQYVHHIQIGRKAMQEMEDKIEVLKGELECCRTKLEERQGQMESAVGEHRASIDERDALKSELSQLQLLWIKKMAIVDEESAKIERCMFGINRHEKEMISVKESFERLLQNRNFTGLLLIDRNDELCIFYEKFNVQARIQKEGELALREKEDKLRLLKIQIADVQRSIEAAKKTKQHIPSIDVEIAWLQCQLLNAKSESNSASMAVENPTNVQRWRLLEGTDPEPEQLESQIRQLTSALDIKRGQWSQRELVSTEIAKSIAEMECQVKTQGSSAAQLGRQLVKYERRNAEMIIRLKATTAELAITQATAMDLVTKRDALLHLVGNAKLRFEAGLPPTDQAVSEWERILRHERTIQNLIDEKHQPSDIDDILSRCQPRPNAYIPEALGIPRPFGAGAFKPTKRGSTMRHICRQKISDVVL